MATNMPAPAPNASDDIAVRLSTILSVYVMHDCSGLSTDTNIISDLGLDSLDLVEVAMTIEDEFGIEIHDNDMMKLGTVGQIIDYITNHQPPVPIPVQDVDK
jgi:acyl carrier protein